MAYAGGQSWLAEVSRVRPGTGRIAARGEHAAAAVSRAIASTTWPAQARMDGQDVPEGGRGGQGAGVMSELDVIVIHIRAEQAAEYERLFAERELPRWRDYKARGAFLSARISRVAFGTDNRQDVIKYAIVVEVPSHAAHSEHDADPGFQEFNRLADLLQPEDPLVYGGQVLHAV
jgi:hypothetical protein